MENNVLRNEYRCINDGEKSQWKQLTSIGEFIWDGVYAIRLVMNDSSLGLPFKFNGEEVVNLLVNDQFPDNHIQNNRITVQTLTRVDKATGDVQTYTRTRRYSNGEHKWGEWTTNKRSKTVLPSPQNLVQELVHLSDYIASRSDIHILFEENEAKPTLPDPNEYTLNFGKHSGKSLVYVFEHHRDYLEWCTENIKREPLMSLIKLLEEQEKSQEDDEI